MNSGRTQRASRVPGRRRWRQVVVASLLCWAWSGRAAEPAHDHWAFRPVSVPALPAVRDTAWPRNGVDHFILARLEQGGLAPAGAAARRDWIRRVTYDLTGLPPSIEEVRAFEQDAAAGAYERVVERLLSSAHYGEQWGRHWLDLVRYADTAGENTDRPLTHAWRYRNWVIEAFNRDQPYDEFLREQIAGDLMAEGGPPERYGERVVATGYLAIARRFGHDIEKDMHLTFEDTIDNLGKVVLGLSVGCARCHNHKYDPISTRDYYGLYGIFGSSRFAYPGCEPTQKTRDMVPLLPAAEAERLLKPFETQLSKLDEELKRMDGELSGLRKAAEVPSTAALGSGDLAPGSAQSVSVGVPDQASTWVPVKRGEMLQLTILQKANHGADATGIELEITEQGGSNRVWNVTRDVMDDFYEGGAGAQHGDRFGHSNVWHVFDLVPGPTLFSEFVRDSDKTPGLQVWRGGAGTPSAMLNVTTNTLRFYTVVMPPRTFGLHPGPQGPVALAWQSPIDGAVSVRGRIFEMDPGGDGVGWKLEKRPGIGATLAAQKGMLAAQGAVRKRREAFLAGKPAVPVAYGVVEGKAPGNARVQRRGEPADLGEEVPRKFLDVLGGQLVQATNQSGRLELAEWLITPTNPLTARVMANRVWQWHFGRGLVATPNDFGTRGAPPTHPELLDYLASEFVRAGWSLKALHRLILSSATYQMASDTGQVRGQGAGGREEGAGAGNHPAASVSALESYAFFPRRRLTAEELRDALLVMSGELDRTPGGAHPFPAEETWSFTQHGPFAAEYETSKRSVYVMQKRNRRQPFFALFDGADPNATTPMREVTTVPTQALFFMNDRFLHERAEKFTGRILAAAEDDAGRTEFAYGQIYGRAASGAERAEAVEFLRDYAATCSDRPLEERGRLAWSALARVWLSANEFLYLD